MPWCTIAGVARHAQRGLGVALLPTLNQVRLADERTGEADILYLGLPIGFLLLARQSASRLALCSCFVRRFIKILIDFLDGAQASDEHYGNIYERSHSWYFCPPHPKNPALG